MEDNANAGYLSGSEVIVGKERVNGDDDFGDGPIRRKGGGVSVSGGGGRRKRSRVLMLQEAGDDGRAFHQPDMLIVFSGL